ncbi:hypothetical protein C6988_00525 [Nitrosopumilus sp. b1]|nr:hypothetical protein C6988_00525 [Nitrosopumilus sp. b1]
MTYDELFLIIFSMLIVFPPASSVFGEEESIFPDWIKQVIELWVNEKISDQEFIDLIENVLNSQIIPSEVTLDESSVLLVPKSEINEKTGVFVGKDNHSIPTWAKERAAWWVEGKITDEQFLRTLHYLRNMGIMEYNPEISIFSEEDTHDSSLEKYLLTQEEISRFTQGTIWRFVSTEYEFEEKEGVVDSVKIILKDIKRMHDPIFNKYKVPSMMMQITEFNNKKDLENYWNSFEKDSEGSVFSRAYMVGSPSDNSDCFFSYTYEGAVSSCTYDSMVIQVVIYDEYNEHYEYSKKDLLLDRSEPTTRFMGEILQKIGKYKDQKVNDRLDYVLQKNSSDETQKIINSEPEKSKIYGIKNFSCQRDDFGLVKITGQYNNDERQKQNVDLQITFFDGNNLPVGKNTVSLHDVKEFESRKFIGYTKWTGQFLSCDASVLDSKNPT